MDIVKVVLTYILTIYLVLLIGTVIISWIRSFARDWSPTGFLLVICESVLSTTDPPLRFLRRFIRPIRLGGMSLDLSFMVLFFLVVILLEWVVPAL